MDRLWARLADGGTPLMPLDAYPFSERYGWTHDRYGLSWQVSYAGGEPVTQRITPTLTFVGDVCGKAEEAIAFYTSVLPDASNDFVQHYGRGEEPDLEGTVQYAAFRLAGQAFAAMDSAREHEFAFNEAISFLVYCDSQEELDRYWNALSSTPESEQCGWLKDRYGVSWQIIPSNLDQMLQTGSKEQVARVTKAFLAMKKLDLGELERAYAATA